LPPLEKIAAQEKAVLEEKLKESAAKMEEKEIELGDIMSELEELKALQESQVT